MLRVEKNPFFNKPPEVGNRYFKIAALSLTLLVKCNSDATVIATE